MAAVEGVSRQRRRSGSKTGANGKIRSVAKDKRAEDNNVLPYGGTSGVVPR